MKTEAQRLSELPHMELVTMLSVTAVYNPTLYLAASFRIIELEHKLRLAEAKLAAADAKADGEYAQAFLWYN